MEDFGSVGKPRKLAQDLLEPATGQSVGGEVGKAKVGRSLGEKMLFVRLVGEFGGFWFVFGLFWGFAVFALFLSALFFRRNLSFLWLQKAPKP